MGSGSASYYLEVRGANSSITGSYKLKVSGTARGPTPPNRSPRISGGLDSGATYTAGGAAVVENVKHKFSDPDDDYVWLQPSSDDESVATVAWEGRRMMVYPHAAGRATVTVTGRDPDGESAEGSYAVHVQAPTRTDPAASFNAEGDELTLSFTDQFAPGETRAHQTRMRQKSPRGGWNRFCVTATNTGNSAQTQNVSIDLPMAGIAEPGVTYETVYRLIGSSCDGGLNDLWSRPAEATAPGTASFDIDLVFVGTPAADLREAVEEAAQYWERVLTMGIPNVDFSRDPLSCMSGAPRVADVVDDLRLFVKIGSIDGPGGVGGQLATCSKRGVSAMPSVAKMTLDADNYGSSNTARLRQVAVHEIAHALGFLGDIWRPAHLLRNPSLPVDPGASNPPDTHFVGSRAIAAFDAAGGSSYAQGKVPVENRTGGSGSQDSHWREDVMGNELMTPALGGGSNPLSAVTIQALADMGYHVDVSQAESYRLPSGSVSISAKSAKQEGAEAVPVFADCVVEDNAGTVDDSREIVRELEPSSVRMRPLGVQ